MPVRRPRLLRTSSRGTSRAGLSVSSSSGLFPLTGGQPCFLVRLPYRQIPSRAFRALGSGGLPGGRAGRLLAAKAEGVAYSPGHDARKTTCTSRRWSDFSRLHPKLRPGAFQIAPVVPGRVMALLRRFDPFEGRAHPRHRLWPNAARSLRLAVTPGCHATENSGEAVASAPCEGRPSMDVIPGANEGRLGSEPGAQPFDTNQKKRAAPQRGQP